MVELCLAAAVLGVFVGICSGLLGIGGGMVMIPAFRLLIGMSPLASTATSLFTIIPTSVSGVISRVRNRTCHPKLGLALGLSGACLSPVGVWLANQAPGWLVMVAAAIVMGYSAITMFRKALKAPRAGANAGAAGSSAADKAASPNAAATPDTPAFTVERRHILIGIAIGLGTGLISGFVGVGGGFIMIPLMMSIIGLPMREASGTSLVAVMILAIPGAILQGMLGNIDFVAGIACACGTIPGAYLGGILVKRIPERQLRFTFACFLLIAAILLATQR